MEQEIGFALSTSFITTKRAILFSMPQPHTCYSVVDIYYMYNIISKGKAIRTINALILYLISSLHTLVFGAAQHHRAT